MTTPDTVEETVAAFTKTTAKAGLVGIALAVSAALVAPGHAAAEPVAPETTTPGATAPESTSPTTAAPTAPGTTESETPSLTGIPGDAELTEILRSLKQSGGSEKAIEALKSILGSEGQLDPAALLGKLGLGTDPSTTPTTPTSPTVPGTTPTAPAGVTPNQVAETLPGLGGDIAGTLQKLTGAQLLSPAIAPFCTAPTDDNPLGIVTAPAVAVPGPWPVKEGTVIGDLLKGIGGDKLVKLLDEKDAAPVQEIKKGETAFALVPPAKTDSDQLQVAWFNTQTLKGGFAPLKPIKDDKGAGPILKALAAADGFHGIRMARVGTGEGTVLTAVFGTTTTAGRACYFLPAIGTVKN